MQHKRLALAFLALLAMAWASALAGQSANSSAASATEHTPFVTAVFHNWSSWDTNTDGILSAAEVDAVVSNPNVRHEDAAAAVALKLALRSTKQTLPPLTREYFAAYEKRASSLPPSKAHAEAEDDRSDSNDPSGAATVVVHVTGVPINWDRSFARFLCSFAFFASHINVFLYSIAHFS